GDPARHARRAPHRAATRPPPAHRRARRGRGLGRVLVFPPRPHQGRPRGTPPTRPRPHARGRHGRHRPPRRVGVAHRQRDQHQRHRNGGGGGLRGRRPPPRRPRQRPHRTHPRGCEHPPPRHR